MVFGVMDRMGLAETLAENMGREGLTARWDFSRFLELNQSIIARIEYLTGKAIGFGF